MFRSSRKNSLEAAHFLPVVTVYSPPTMRFTCVALILSLFFGSAAGAKEHEIQDREATIKARYLDLIAKEARKSYFPLQGFESSKCAVSFQVDCKGSTLNLHVDEAPQDAKQHKSALADSALTFAVKNLRLPAPPPDVQCPATVQLIFDGRPRPPVKVSARIIEPGALSEKSPKVTEKSQRGTSH